MTSLPTVASATARRPIAPGWAWRHAALLALTLLALHLILLKLVRSIPHSPWLLAVVLAAIWTVVWLNRRSARVSGRRSALLNCSRLQDRETLTLLAIFFVLVLAFHLTFVRAGGDGRDYFAQARSLVIDRDLDFGNEIAQFGARAPRNYPFGSALLWIPFFLACHLWLAVIGLFDPVVIRDGFWNPYQIAVGLGTLVYGFAGLWLIFRVLREHFSFSTAVASTIGVCSASFLLWYLTVDSSYAHGNTLFTVTLFWYLWYRTRRRRTPGHWAALGAAAGFMTMVRWQNAIFIPLPVLDSIASQIFAGGRGDSKPTLARLALSYTTYGLAALIAFAPQMGFWNVVNGGWLAVPHDQAGQQWWRDPLMMDVLFSSNHGLLSWHPILYLALLGVPLFFRREPRFAAWLALGFLGQVYVNGAVAVWYGGSAFGGRRFDSCILLFALGLASTIQAVRRQPMIAIWTTVAALTVANIALMWDIQHGRFDPGAGVTFDRMVQSVYDRVGNPFSFPRNAFFAWRYRTSPARYDQVGQQWYFNIRIDVGGADDGRFLAGGWSQPEGEGSLSFRWAVTDRSWVVLPVKNALLIPPGEPQRLSDYRLRFRAQPFSYPESPPQSIEVYVNGHFLGRQVLGRGWRDYEVEIAHGLLRRHLNGVEFRYAYARSPEELRISRDPRPLAVRFDLIELLQR